MLPYIRQKLRLYGNCTFFKSSFHSVEALSLYRSHLRSSRLCYVVFYDSAKLERASLGGAYNGITCNPSFEKIDWKFGDTQERSWAVGGAVVRQPWGAAESKGRQNEYFNWIKKKYDSLRSMSFNLLTEIKGNSINKRFFKIVYRLCQGQPLWLLAPGTKNPSYATGGGGPPPPHTHTMWYQMPLGGFSSTKVASKKKMWSFTCKRWSRSIYLPSWTRAHGLLTLALTRVRMTRLCKMYFMHLRTVIAKRAESLRSY